MNIVLRNLNVLKDLNVLRDLNVLINFGFIFLIRIWIR